MYFTNNAIAPYKGKRRLDRRFRRYNDGIKDIGIQIKQKARELAGYFKQLPNSKKVVFVISQIGKIVGILLAKSAKGEALTAEDKILRDKLRKRIEDLKTFSEMRGFDASETINKKQEQLNSIESKDTRFKLKLFVSLVSTFASLIGDWFVLRTPKAEQLVRRDNAIKRFGDISRDNARRVLFAIVTAAAGFALSKLINKIRDPKHANEIRAGRLKESDYVKDFADNFLKKSSIMVPMNDPEAAEFINESLNIVRNARTIDELLSVFPGNRELMNAKRLYSELKMTRDSALKRRIDKAVRKHVRMALKDAGVQGMKKGQHVKARDPEYLKRIKGGGAMTATKPSNITSPNRKGFKYGSENKVNNIVRSFNRTTSTERQAAATKAAQKQHAAAVARSPKKIITRQAAKMNFKPAVKALALAGAGTAALLAGSKALANHRRKKAIEARRAQRNQQ